MFSALNIDQTHPNGTSIGSAVFAGFTLVNNRQTDHARCVTITKPPLHLVLCTDKDHRCCPILAVSVYVTVRCSVCLSRRSIAAATCICRRNYIDQYLAPAPERSNEPSRQRQRCDPRRIGANLLRLLLETDGQTYWSCVGCSR